MRFKAATFALFLLLSIGCKQLEQPVDWFLESFIAYNETTGEYEPNEELRNKVVAVGYTLDLLGVPYGKISAGLVGGGITLLSGLATLRFNKQRKKKRTIKTTSKIKY